MMTTQSKFGSGSNDSARRRRVVRVRADLRVVIAFKDGDKRPARVLDVSIGGMHVRCDRVPEYGEVVKVVVQLRQSDDWHFLPGAVRWFTSQGFGVGFEGLDETQAAALAAFVEQAAA
jgi:Tfp pilus assembly protein PilZ